MKKSFSPAQNINRRKFLAFAGGATLALASGPAFAAKMINYKPGVIEKALSQGKTVFVDYAAHWCSTCKSQERTIKALRAENPQYEKMVFVRVDWDEYSSHEISRKHKIPRRSTLIVLKGDKELGRIVAGTNKRKIKSLMDTGLAAATS